jgi:hypothetical protein
MYLLRIQAISGMMQERDQQQLQVENVRQMETRHFLNGRLAEVGDVLVHLCETNRKLHRQNTLLKERMQLSRQGQEVDMTSLPLVEPAGPDADEVMTMIEALLREASWGNLLDTNASTPCQDRALAASLQSAHEDDFVHVPLFGLIPRSVLVAFGSIVENDHEVAMSTLLPLVDAVESGDINFQEAHKALLDALAVEENENGNPVPVSEQPRLPILTAPCDAVVPLPKSSWLTTSRVYAHGSFCSGEAFSPIVGTCTDGLDVAYGANAGLHVSSISHCPLGQKDIRLPGTVGGSACEEAHETTWGQCKFSRSQDAVQHSLAQHGFNHARTPSINPHKSKGIRFGVLPSQAMPSNAFEVPRSERVPEVVTLTTRRDASSRCRSALIQDNIRTLIVRNIPARITQNQLLSYWRPQGSFNLLHLPYSQQLHRNVGYAFINFISREALTEFYERWQHKKLVASSNSKPLNVGVAEVQGFEANLRHMKLSKKMLHIRNRHYLPFLPLPDGSFADFREVIAALPDDDVQYWT